MDKVLIQKFIAHLKGQGIVNNQKDFALKIGYLSESSFSQAIRKNPLPDELILKIKNVYSCFEEWINNNDKTIIQEVTPVPEDDYMMVEFEDLETAAGKLGGGDLSVLPERKRRLVPKEYKKGNYLVVRVHGHSMDDNTKRSISEGEELLIKECFESDFNLPIRNKLFVIVTNEGSVIKQIKEIDKENQRVICHSFNPNWEDYSISFNEIIQLFTVEKKVKSNIIF